MEQPREPHSVRRLIKRYSNRKLYDTGGSQYVTLQQIAALVRAGEDVQIIDNSTKEDKTEATLALIISEELKARPRGIPLATLKELVRHRGERLLLTLREGPIGRLMPRDELGAGTSEARAEQEPSPSADAAGAQSLLAAADGELDSTDLVLLQAVEIKRLSDEVARLNERLVRLEALLSPELE